MAVVPSKPAGVVSRIKQARPPVQSPRGAGPYGWRPSSGQKPSTGWNTSPTNRPNLPRVPDPNLLAQMARRKLAGG